MDKIFVLGKKFFVLDKIILSRINLILSRTKNILSRQMDRAFVSDLKLWKLTDSQPPYNAISNLKVLMDVDLDVSFKECSSIFNVCYVGQSPPHLLHKMAFQTFPTCGWKAAITLTKWNKVGSALFCNSLPIWIQNEH